jgi:hypothetical protein
MEVHIKYISALFGGEFVLPRGVTLEDIENALEAHIDENYDLYAYTLHLRSVDRQTNNTPTVTYDVIVNDRVDYLLVDGTTGDVPVPPGTSSDQAVELVRDALASERGFSRDQVVLTPTTPIVEDENAIPATHAFAVVLNATVERAFIVDHDRSHEFAADRFEFSEHEIGIIQGALKAFIRGRGVTEIDLTQIYARYRITEVYDEAFSNLPTLRIITIPPGVTVIGSEAFAECTGLQTVRMQPGIKVIGRYSFNNCTSLRTFVLPSGVEELQEGVFNGCTGLQTVRLGGIKVIGRYSFNNCNKLQIIHIPDGIKEIRQGAFRNCRSLTTITFPESLWLVGDDAFENCVSLRTVTTHPNSRVVYGARVWDGSDIPISRQRELSNRGNDDARRRFGR